MVRRYDPLLKTCPSCGSQAVTFDEVLLADDDADLWNCCPDCGWDARSDAAPTATGFAQPVQHEQE
jgi:alpha-D-ribose 1-methylphosphonate 5-phosphate C-P lyase